jgi:NAD(P)-dependent dehydrogenase (short-subunit alcohol dehydrogenase family)
MNASNQRSSATRAKTLSYQSLTRDTMIDGGDHPAGGAVHPVPGTIKAPIIIVGATGTIGSAVARQLVAAGQLVIAVAPRLDRLGTLRDSAPHGAITPVAAHVDDEASARRLAERLQELGRPIAGVVVTFPHGHTVATRQQRGRLLDQSTEALADCLRQTLLAQHALARHLIPLLADSGRNASYVIVGGPGSETPWAGYGHRSVAMAGTRMLARVLHDEARSSGVRVQLISIDSPLRGETPSEHECPEWPTANQVAGTAVRLIDRTSSEESKEAVVTGVRSAAARPADSAPRAFVDVPSFLATLRNPANKLTPQ